MKERKQEKEKERKKEGREKERKKNPGKLPGRSTTSSIINMNTKGKLPNFLLSDKEVL